MAARVLPGAVRCPRRCATLHLVGSERGPAAVGLLRFQQQAAAGSVGGKAQGVAKRPFRVRKQQHQGAILAAARGRDPRPGGAETVEPVRDVVAGLGVVADEDPRLVARWRGEVDASRTRASRRAVPSAPGRGSGRACRAPCPRGPSRRRVSPAGACGLGARRRPPAAHTASSKAGNPLFMADTPAPGRGEVSAGRRHRQRALAQELLEHPPGVRLRPHAARPAPVCPAPRCARRRRRPPARGR